MFDPHGVRCWITSVRTNNLPSCFGLIGQIAIVCIYVFIDKDGFTLLRKRFQNLRSSQQRSNRQENLNNCIYLFGV